MPRYSPTTGASRSRQIGMMPSDTVSSEATVIRSRAAWVRHHPGGPLDLGNKVIYWVAGFGFLYLRGVSRVFAAVSHGNGRRAGRERRNRSFWII
jgi:hypothetical protein